MKLAILETHKIENCKFSFECKAKWNDLIKTTDSLVRMCSQCNQEVHRCDTDEQLDIAILANKCVAIHKYKSKNGIVLTMGSVWYDRE
jgi:hypothetical protein